MSSAARKLPSLEELYAEIRALPEGMTGEILEPGVLRTMSRPGKSHRRAARLVLHGLRRFDETLSGAGWWLEVEAEVLLPGGLLVVPDLSGWRVERVPELPDDNPIAIVPDFCAEVLSPSTARIDKATKLPLYARSGVQWVWLIDPLLRLIEVYETIDGKPTLMTSAQDEDRRALPPFDVEMDVGPWWPPTPAT
jgi:Uma2 family endonuclease